MLWIWHAREALGLGEVGPHQELVEDDVIRNRRESVRSTCRECSELIIEQEIREEERRRRLKAEAREHSKGRKGESRKTAYFASLCTFVKLLV